jgi:hypothetical protein
MNFILAGILGWCMVGNMKHTTNIKVNFSYQTAYNTKNGELTITLFRDRGNERINLNWWEAIILLNKLKLELGEK